MIVLIGGEKGGTGKTTLSTNLATNLILNGEDVLVIDTDPQGSFTTWSSIRDETAKLNPDMNIKRVTCVVKTGKTIHKEIEDLKNRFKHIVIDAGGKDSVELRSAMLVADKMYSPIQPSQFDVWTTANMEVLVEQAKIVNPKLNAYIVISKAHTNAKVTDASEAKNIVADLDSINLANSIIYERQIYRKAAKNGLSVMEYDNNKAILEFGDFYKEVFGVN